MGALTAKSITIADGQTEPTGNIDLSGNTLVGVYLDSGFDGTTLTFKSAHSRDDTALVVKDGAGSSISLTVAASQYVKIKPEDLAGINYLVPVAGTSQTGDTVLTFIVKSI